MRRKVACVLLGISAAAAVSLRTRTVRKHREDWLQRVRAMGNTSLAVLLFDVGANSGEWTARMVDQVDKLAPGSMAEPHIFEPQPMYAPRLQALAQAVPSGFFLPVAAHTRGGHLTFYFGNGNESTSASLVASHMAGAAGSVTVATLDFARYLCQRAHGCAHGGCIGFLKVDVEGAEYPLLAHVVRRAGSALCQLFTHILVEWHFDKADASARREALAFQVHLNETLHMGCQGLQHPAPFIAHDIIPLNNKFAQLPGEMERAEASGGHAAFFGSCPAPDRGARPKARRELLSGWRKAGGAR